MATMELSEVTQHVKGRPKALIETAGVMKEYEIVITAGVACAKVGKRFVVIEGHRLPSGQVVLYFGKLGEFG